MSKRTMVNHNRDIQTDAERRNSLLKAAIPWKIRLNNQGIPEFPKLTMENINLQDAVNYCIGAAKALKLSNCEIHISYSENGLGDESVSSCFIYDTSKMFTISGSDGIILMKYNENKTYFRKANVPYSAISFQVCYISAVTITLLPGYVERCLSFTYSKALNY